MVENLIAQGLERFSMGDLAGATRIWLAARAIVPDDLQLQSYLDHVRQVSPALYAHIEAEATSRARGEPPPLPRPVLVAMPPLESAPLSAGAPLVVPTMPRAPHPAAPAAAVAPAPAQVIRGEPDPWDQGEGRIEVSSAGPGLSLVDGVRTARASASAPAPRGPPTGEQTVSTDILLEQLREAMSLDNFTGALDLADRILRREPDHVEAQHAVKRCQTRLITIYASKLGELDEIPHVRIPPGEVIWLDLDHRAGFVLAQVDGQSSYEDIIELTGMERLEALRILCNLLQKKIIGVRGG